MAASSVFETQSVGAARRYMSEVFRSHDLAMPAGQQRIRMRHEAVRSGGASLHWLTYGAPVTMSAPGMERFYLFQFVLGGACEIRHRGRDVAVGGGHSYVVHPSDPLAKTWDDGCHQLIVKVDRSLLDGFASREMGVDAEDRLDFDFDVLPVSIGPQCIVDLAHAIRDDAAEQRNCLSHPRLRGHLDVTMMSLLLASFPHRFSAVYDRAGEACAPYYVRRAEDHIRAHLRKQITIDDLAQAAGVSVRSLFNGFRQFRGCTPMSYVKALRLDLAREELTCARASGQSVTDVALACGFTHMSKFARDFAARFGEKPSAVLGRKG